jgi:cyclic pyranopterin phosphate synthase
MSSELLTHLDDDGRARMVDVGAKPETDRVATARGVVRMTPKTAATVMAGDAPKGDVIGTARLAAIQAAKRTDEWIPLAHTLPLNSVDVDIDVDAEAGTVIVAATARVYARTGVEMEAMVACAAGALCIYDMVKGIERGVVIERVELLSKSGGRSGTWRRDDQQD